MNKLITDRKETYKNIPECLKALPNWLVYRLIEDKDAKPKDGKPPKPKKVPFDAKTGQAADATDPQSWCDFDTAMAALHDDPRNEGLGFGIAEPYVFTDLDNCRNPETGEPEEWALEIIADLDSYTELSPSGTGVHILCRSTKPLPCPGRKEQDVEMYCGKRFFTMTGAWIDNTPDGIEERTDKVLRLYENVFGNPEPASTRTAPAPVLSSATTGTDETIVAACRTAKNAEKFIKLFDQGDTAEYGGDDSKADAALCAILAYRTRDPEQIDRIFRRSALMRPKWDELRGDGTYGQKTIDKAIKIQKSVPPGFSVTDEGVYFQAPGSDNGEAKPPMHLSSKVEIIAATRNADGGDWGRLLRWHDMEGRQHTWAMPMSMLAGEGNEILAELLAGGMVIAPGRKARELFKSYLQETQPPVFMKSVSRVGWNDRLFIFPDSTVGGTEDGEEVVFQGAGIDHQFTISGTLNDWKLHVAAKCVSNSRLVFGVSVAFAAPLLHVVDVESGGFQFVGTSSTGKSTAGDVAASVFGGQKYVRSWRATANGLEGIASLHNDALLVLDEIGQATPKDVGETTYMLANEQGKLRMGRSGGLRKALRWRLLFLSSGELGLRDYLMGAGVKVRGGQEVRCLDIDADGGKNLGLFENTHGYPDGDSFSKALKKVAHQYHGIAGRTFIGHVAMQHEESRRWVEEQIGAFMQEHCRKHSLTDASGEVYRALSRFALVAAAGELATKVGITGWGEGEAERAASVCFKAWLNRRGGKGVRDVDAGIRQVKGFLERHGSSRFQDKKTDAGTFSTPTVSNRVGFRSRTNDGEYVYYVLPEAFQNELCAGYDHRLIAKELASAGHLEHDAGRLTKKTRLPDVGNVSAYLIRPSLLSEPEMPTPKVSFCDLLKPNREKEEQAELLM